MRRTLEPEGMDDAAEAREYAAMDHSAPNRAFVDRLVDLGVRGRALDIGTGPGHVPVLVCECVADLHVVGIDLAPAMLELAAATRDAHPEIAGRIDLRLADGKSLAFDDRSFDAVFSNTVLHHVADPVPFLAEAARVLRPSGCLLIRDLRRPPTAERASELVALHADGASATQRELLRASLHAALTPDELRAAADRAGLDDAEVVVDSDRHVSLQRCARPRGAP